MMTFQSGILNDLRDTWHSWHALFQKKSKKVASTFENRNGAVVSLQHEKSQESSHRPGKSPRHTQESLKQKILLNRILKLLKKISDESLLFSIYRSC